MKVAMPPISPLSKVLEPNFILLLLYEKKKVIDKKNFISKMFKLCNKHNKTKRCYWCHFKTAPSQHKEHK